MEVSNLPKDFFQNAEKGLVVWFTQPAYGLAPYGPRCAFYPGQVVEGKVFWKAEEEVKVLLETILSTAEHVGDYELKDGEWVKKTLGDTFFRRFEQSNMFGKKPTEVSVKVGEVREFPFEFKIPYDCPHTIEIDESFGEHFRTNVECHMSVTIRKTQGYFYASTNKSMFIRYKKWTIPKELLEPVVVERTKQFLLSKESLDVSIKLNKGVFYYIEPKVLEIHVDNKTDKPIKSIKIEMRSQATNRTYRHKLQKLTKGGPESKKESIKNIKKSGSLTPPLITAKSKWSDTIKLVPSEYDRMETIEGFSLKSQVYLVVRLDIPLWPDISLDIPLSYINPKYYDFVDGPHPQVPSSVVEQKAVTKPRTMCSLCRSRITEKDGSMYKYTQPWTEGMDTYLCIECFDRYSHLHPSIGLK